MGQIQGEEMTKRIEIEYELKAEEDDDIQDYKKPWVGLTEEKVDEIYTSVQEEVNEHWDKGGTTMMFPITLYKAIEQALKERNT
jgi:hypothetical protein